MGSNKEAPANWRKATASPPKTTFGHANVPLFLASWTGFAPVRAWLSAVLGTFCLRRRVFLPRPAPSRRIGPQVFFEAVSGPLVPARPPVTVLGVPRERLRGL